MVAIVPVLLDNHKFAPLPPQRRDQLLRVSRREDGVALGDMLVATVHDGRDACRLREITRMLPGGLDDESYSVDDVPLPR